jgi:transcriptional regulator with XRE-family HTH domain
VASHPNPVDVHVGSRVRLRRTLLGMSQEKLGKAVSLTFQQIQKYERGANRIGSSRLYQLATILDVPVSFFFDGVEERIDRAEAGVAENDQAAFESDQFSRRETLELVRAYYRITDPSVRKRVFELVKSVSTQTTDDTE